MLELREEIQRVENLLAASATGGADRGRQSRAGLERRHKELQDELRDQKNS